MSGLYIHIPFCEKRCAYCNFYSACCTDSLKDRYLQALNRQIIKWGGSLGRPLSSVYIGGGTPSVLGKNIFPLMECIKNNFTLTEGCEITAEMNPAVNAESFLKVAFNAGINRLSIGAQSANDNELKILGRTHTKKDIENCFFSARKIGFTNISLDLMTGLPESDNKSLKRSIDFLTELEPEHISAYILKIEEKTLLSKRDDLKFADEEMQSEQYLYTCELLKEKGYSHYEISNFAKLGFEGRHNLKYWHCEEYLGIGPSAHSFLNGERFFYPDSISEFIKNPHTVSDGSGGDLEEYFMLNLRLSSGIDLNELSRRFSVSPNPNLYKYLNLLSNMGYISLNADKFSLTDKGMLLSNTVITEILERLL